MLERTDLRRSRALEQDTSRSWSAVNRRDYSCFAVLPKFLAGV